MTRYYLPSFVAQSAGMLLVKGEVRPIYWRVTFPGQTVTGVFHDLKTLRGASKRLVRQFPSWGEIEVRFNPFGGDNV